jgi:hypothetical protein
MKNVIALVVCLLITLATLFLPRTIKSSDEVDTIYCGSPIPYMTLDLSNHSEFVYPKSLNCGFSLFSAKAVSIDWFGLLISTSLLLVIAEIFMYAKSSQDPNHTQYSASPIKKDIDATGSA